MSTIDNLRRVAEVEFADIVKSSFYIGYKLRIVLINDSFVDVNLSRKLPEKFGFHWECLVETGTFYRYDNFPDKNWQSLGTFPHHFHNGSQDYVEVSPFPLSPVEGFRAFMEFVKNKLNLN
ncbi:MAG TPA: hypothetical protein DCY12_03120 [Candidatus Atribacteria bacterium]|nr:hypothetical protein [Candidatus Atribacteria bacterium]